MLIRKLLREAVLEAVPQMCWSWQCLQGDDNFIAGFQDAVRGMRPGGKRRAVIPPTAGYADQDSKEPQPPTFAMRRQLINHARESLLFELQMLQVRKP